MTNSIGLEENVRNALFILAEVQMLEKELKGVMKVLRMDGIIYSCTPDLNLLDLGESQISEGINNLKKAFGVNS